MENVKISKVCGLCAGCKYAIETTQKELAKKQKVTLFKEIVHNKNVNAMLEKQGVVFANKIEELSPEGVVVVRAHGEPKSTFEIFKQNGINYVDCTCVNVKNIHEKVQKFSKLGYKIIIIGKYGKKTGVIHPEIAGTIGWCETEPILIEDNEDADNFVPEKNNKYYLVCQTTFNMEKADALISVIENNCKKTNTPIEINKSICLAQKQINVFSEELAKDCDLMIVVGGKNSSNSIELFNNIKQFANAIFIEDISTIKNVLDENNIILTKNIRIGLTAGASTMKSELEELKKHLEQMIKEL